MRLKPREIAGAAALGFFLGIVPKANLLAVLIAVLLLLLPVNLVVGLAVAVVVSLITPWIAPFADELGGFVLMSNTGQRIGGATFRLPLVPWTMLDNTLVVGSFLIGLLLFIPVFLIVWTSLRLFMPRKQAEAKSDVQAEAAKPPYLYYVRLLILALLVVIVWVFRDTVIRWQFVAQIQSQSGADAELDAVRTHMPSGSIELTGLCLFDPKEQSRKLLSVDKITSLAAPKDLMQRYFHFPTVSLQGIRIEVDGADGSQLVPDALWTKLKQNLADVVSDGDTFDWTAFLTNDPETVVKNLLNELESVKFAEQLRDRWPKEVEQIRQRAESLKTRFANVKNLADKTKQPGDKLELVGGILQELDGADQGVRELLVSVAQLQEKAKLDFNALVTVSQQDQTSLRSLKPPSINTTNITESLLGNEIREQWNQTVTWGDWARSLLVPVELDDGTLPVYERFGLTPPKKVRGETIPFVAQDARPELLFDTVDLTGQILFGELPIFFNGSVQNVASPLQLGPEPMIAQFCFSGNGVPPLPTPPAKGVDVPLPMPLDANLLPNIFIELRVDRLNGKEEDQLIVQCPIYELPARILGDPKKVALAVTPGRSRLDGVIDFKGEKLDGQIRIIQESVRLTAALPDQLRNTSFERVLQETLEGLDGFEADIFVSGTRSQPQYVFKSNIADKLRPQIENLVLAEWDGIRKKTDIAVANEVNKAVGVLNDAVQKHLDPLVQEANGQKALLEQQIAQATGLPLDQFLQSQLSQLSPQDQQKLGQLVNTPLIQSLLKSDGTPNKVEQLLQQGTQKLPGVLEKLLNR